MSVELEVWIIVEVWINVEKVDLDEVDCPIAVLEKEIFPYRPAPRHPPYASLSSTIWIKIHAWRRASKQ